MGSLVLYFWDGVVVAWVGLQLGVVGVPGVAMQGAYWEEEVVKWVIRDTVH